MFTELNYDIAIIGSGVVGLSLAYQLKNKYSDAKIIIIEKESEVGLHSSGRNSGILHAGIYYKPNSLKAKVCIEGAKRLKNWCLEEKLEILQCGKVISPQTSDLDPQLDVLFNRAKSNNVEIEFLDEQKFKEKVPDGRTSTGRALWSPNTCVVNSKEVIKRLFTRLLEKNVAFKFNTLARDFDINKKNLIISSKDKKYLQENRINYRYLFNCAGINSLEIAKNFGIGENFITLPFKGTYWKLAKNAPFNFQTNLYPVPDLNTPFLGIHITPSCDGSIYLGPTAIPALGLENYYELQNFEPFFSMNFASILIKQWIYNHNGFRKYTKEQAFQGIKPFFVKAAKKLVPNLKTEHLVSTKKVGIRPQLFDKSTNKLVDDFKLEKISDTFHVLNSISPAFTASFALADLIIDETKV